MHDLQTRLPTILAWLEAGEEVVVKPKEVKAAKTKTSTADPPVYLDRSGKPLADSSTVKSRSIALHRPLAPKPMMTQEELQEFYEDMRGSY